MNNKRILIVGVLAAIVTMMVGYALFSETITINGTATAKGDFEITESCQTGITDNIKNLASVLEAKEENAEGGYSNDTCTVNGNKVSFSADLKYPGATRYFTIILKNTGSITAYVGDAITEGKFCLDDDGDGVAENCTSDSFLNVSFLEAGLIKEDETIIDFNSDEAVEFNRDDIDTVAIKPGQSVIMLGISTWDSRLSTEEYNNKLFKSELSITFDFKQYNE